MLLLAVSVNACSTESSLADPTDVSNRFWSIRVNHPAVQLSLASGYDTVSLAAVTYQPDNTPWYPTEEISSIRTHWRSEDSTTVRVSPEGFVTARRTTGANGLLLFVSRQIDGVTLADTVRVHVSNLMVPFVLDSFRVRPTDSLKRAASTLFPLILPVVVKDTGHQIITGLPIAFRSLQPEIAK